MSTSSVSRSSIAAALSSSRAPSVVSSFAAATRTHRSRDRPALTVCLLYKSRWQVELFFKWIKQHLRIKAFYGYSENAVKTQIWIAVSVYVLVAIVKKRLALETSLHEILQVLSVALFEQVPILRAFDAESQASSLDISTQLMLFDL